MRPDDPHDNVIHLPGVRPPSPPLTPRTGDGPGAEIAEGLTVLDTGPPPPAVMAAVIEAVLFTTADPVSHSRLRGFLGDPEDEDLRAALAQLQTRYERGGHGLRLVEVAGGWQIRTHPRFATWVVRARGTKPVRLSKAALETLSIVAYRQPVTRAEVEDIRGVDSGGVLRMLADRVLIKMLGHKDEPGRPLIYGTTAQFLEMFGLQDLSDLPTLRDLRELKEDDPRGGSDDGPGGGPHQEAGSDPSADPSRMFWLPAQDRSPPPRIDE